MNMKTVAALAALPLLAACAPEIESTVRLSDVLKVAYDGKAFFVPAVLRVPQGSEDSCNKGLANLITNLGYLAPVTGAGSCIQKDGDQLAEIETSMLVANIDSEQPDKSLFVLAVSSVDEVTYDLSFVLNQPIDEIVMALAANSDEMQADLDPAIFTFTLTNDAENAFGVSGYTVFIDEQPSLPDTTPVTLAPNTSAKLVFSDVASAYAEVGNKYTFARITEAP
jgi:hypothetical protein